MARANKAKADGYYAMKSKAFGSYKKPYVVVTPDGILEHEGNYGHAIVTLFSTLVGAQRKAIELHEA